MTEIPIDGFTCLIGKKSTEPGSTLSRAADCVGLRGTRQWNLCCIPIEEINLVREGNSCPRDLACDNWSRSEIKGGRFENFLLFDASLSQSFSDFALSAFRSPCHNTVTWFLYLVTTASTAWFRSPSRASDERGPRYPKPVDRRPCFKHASRKPFLVDFGES